MAFKNKRKNFRKKTGTVPKKVKNYVKKEFDKLVEDKQGGNLIAGYDSSSTANYNLINGLAQGTNQGQRIGMSVKSKYLVLRIVFNQATGFENTNQRCRFLLIWDRAAAGGAPSLAQLLTVTTAGSTFVSPININGSKRYKVLWDGNYVLQSHGGSTNVAEGRTIVKRFRLRTLCKYLDTGATVASIQTNSLYLLSMSQTDVAVRIALTYDFRYEDA